MSLLPAVFQQQQDQFQHNQPCHFELVDQDDIEIKGYEVLDIDPSKTKLVGHTTAFDQGGAWFDKTEKDPITVAQEIDRNPEVSFEFPDVNFKISNGDDPKVRQMLKDAGYQWSGGMDINDFDPGCKFLFMRLSRKIVTQTTDLGYFKGHSNSDFTAELEAELGRS